MFARVNRFRDDPAKLQESERIAEQEIIPQMQRVPGFLGVLSLVDRATGVSLAITFWENEEAMRSSEQDADRVRGELKERTGSNVVSVERYEVSLRVGV